MDRNLTLLIGTVAGVTTRAVGQQGRTLTELRVNVARPARKGDAESVDLITATSSRRRCPGWRPGRP
jgi:hypothetical protein